MWISSRRSPSGRGQKRFLNRARSCGLCGKALGTDRGLYATSEAWSEAGLKLLAAHPACVAEQAERDAERQRALSERLLRAGAAWAAEMRARSRLIVAEARLPSVRPYDGFALHPRAWDYPVGGPGCPGCNPDQANDGRLT